MIIWAKVDGHGSKWAVIRLKVDFPDESKDKSERSRSVKVDGPEIFMSKSGRSKNFKK